VALPSRALALTLPPLTAQQLEARLRLAPTPIIARVEHGEVLLDLRTILPEDQAHLLAALNEVISGTDF